MLQQQLDRIFLVPMTQQRFMRLSDTVLHGLQALKEEGPHEHCTIYMGRKRSGH